MGVGRYNPARSSAGSDLIFALGDELPFFIAGLPFARKAFTSVNLVRLKTAKVVRTSEVRVQ